MSLPLYRRLLGPDFDKLPARVRELHDLDGVSVWQGRAKVERGRSPVSRIAATLSSLPPEGDDQPLRVTFAPVADKEIWARQFGKALFRSVQYERGGLLCERVAISTFVFADRCVRRRSGAQARRLPAPRCADAARCCTRRCAPSRASTTGATISRWRRTCRCSGCWCATAGWLERMVPE